VFRLSEPGRLINTGFIGKKLGKGGNVMFYVYFRGTNYGRWIEAKNLKSAKWIFATQEGINSINYIAGKKKKP
jgi:hypothetical protein